MNRCIRSFSFTLVAGLAVGLCQTTPGYAADAMAPAMDCSKANAMMMAPAKPDAMAMKSMGSVDANYAQMMMMQHKSMVAMAKVEVACGKDAKAKAMAQKQLDQASADDAILEDVLKNASKI